jgi:exopolysaccharide biosynthesis protein
MTLFTKLRPKIRIARAATERVKIELPNGKQVEVNIARYLKFTVQPRLVVFDKQTPLFKWCKEHGIKNAINGGFTLHHNDKLLGEVWSAGKQLKSEKFSEPWHDVRGTVHISNRGNIKIAPRYFLPSRPQGDLLQTGPLLVHKGQSLITPDKDPEGISASSHQFDDDWTGNERYPRAAIGANDDFIFCVAVSGYKPGTIQGLDTGLSLGELADLMINIGATEALNLDGGSSATLVANGKLLNKPQAGQRRNFEVYPEGRPIPNAIVFESLTRI